MDFDNMSDEELTALYEKKKSSVSPTLDPIEALPDDELERLYNEKLQAHAVTPPQNALDKMMSLDSKGIEGFTPSEPNLVAEPKEVGEVLAEAGSNLDAGNASTIAGVYQTGLDIASAVGIDVSQESELNQQVIARLNSEINESTKGDFASMGNLGKILPTLATLPVAYQSKITAFLLEGSLGYAEGRGEGLDKGESAIMGLITGGGTAAVMGAVDYLTRDKSLGLYKYIKKFTNITDKESDEIFSNWQKTMDAPDTPANRTKALIDSMGEKGAEFKIDAAAQSPSATSVIEGNIKARREAVTKLTEGSSTLNHTAEAIAEAADIVKDNYAKVKTHITNTPSDLRLDIPEGLDEATVGDAKALKEIFAKDNIMVADLVDSMPHVNSLLRRTKGVVKNKWSVIKEQIDSSLKKSLSADDYKLWQKANGEYSQMANVTNSSIGKAIKQVKTGEMTPELGIKKIKGLSGGEALFTDLEFLIGKEQTAAFEKSILKEALGKNSEFVDWAHLARALDTKGFVTAEGKNLKEAVDNMAKSFVTDDVLQQIKFKNAGTGAGFSDSLVAKAKFTTIHKLYTSLIKRIPFNETSQHLLKMDELATILRDTNKVKDLGIKMNELSPGVRRLIEDDFVKQATKQIEYKPDATQTGDVNLDPLYVSKQGTVGKNPTEITLGEAQREIVQKHLGSAISTDQVMGTVDKLMASKRAENIIKDVGLRMKADDLAGNQKMLDKIIKTEVDDMVKAISKDSGVQLPRSEVEKLYHMKLDDMMKDCK